MAIILLIIFFIRHILRDNNRIQNLMYKDSKMNIWNLNYLIYRGERKLLPERKMKYAVVYLNLESFRRYNMIYGWTSGEHLLENIVTVLLYCSDADTEICARSQSDRFVLLLNYRDPERFMERIKDLKQQIEDRLYMVSECQMTVHMGVYYIPEDEIDLQQGINHASQALEFLDKQENATIKVYDDSLQQMVKERYDRERLLDSVDTNQDFVVFYQPKVDIRSNEIVGAEALVRFKDPSDNGTIKAPWFFISYYEQTGRVVELDMFVLEATCKMLRRRLDAGLPVVTISCNFSRMHFVKPGFADRFEEILKHYDISKDLVEVEITETLVVEKLHYQTVKENLDVLEERDIQLSIDDFGAGYSSLGIFEQIPASVVKLDRSFFMNQRNRNRQVKIMRGLVKLSEALETQVVCEGVETENDVQLMQEIGTYIAQGYFYSKPIPEDEFEKYLTEGTIKP
jgi:diguanylate cyclase (GGDEF)-like protein